MDEHEIVDELRVIISEEERTTAYFTFSSRMRPSIHEFRLYGPENGLMLDAEIDEAGDFVHADFAKLLDHFQTNLRRAEKATGFEITFERVGHHGGHVIGIEFFRIECVCG